MDKQILTTLLYFTGKEDKRGNGIARMLRCNLPHSGGGGNPGGLSGRPQAQDTHSQVRDCQLSGQRIRYLSTSSSDK